MANSLSVAASDPTSIDNLLRQTTQDASGCLLWTGGVCSGGQPMFKHGNHNLRVARHIFIAVFGDLKKKQWVVEAKCGNLRCIAPEHLQHVPHSRATRRIIGVPLPPGENIKSAGYELVHRARGASVWEPRDIARAVWHAQGLRSCVACGGFLERRGKIFCSRACGHLREQAQKRAALRRPLPGDEALLSDRWQGGDAQAG